MFVCWEMLKETAHPDTRLVELAVSSHGSLVETAGGMGSNISPCATEEILGYDAIIKHNYPGTESIIL